MNKLKDRLIKWLGGYTKDEQFDRPVQIIREEVPIQTFKVERIVYWDWSMRDVVEHTLKHEFVEELMNADPSPIRITSEPHPSEKYSVYTAELRVCMPRCDE